FSEFMLSAYAQQGGAPGKGPFTPGLFDTSLPGDNIGKCQDCHMRDVVGVGCNKKGAPIRPDESAEHPNSGLPLHDLTGGNAWVAGILASAIPGSPNYDQVNYDLLHAPNLTVDLVSGSSNEPEAMIAGMERSKQQLELASSIDDLIYDPGTGDLSFKVQNNTGHKLISGFPEGRRMFVNIVAKDLNGSIIYEVNPYDYVAGTLKGLHYSYDGMGDLPQPLDLSANEVYIDELVYEAHTSSILTGEDHTFHFALATGRYKDNRIPPKGFDIALAPSRHSEPMWQGEPALEGMTDYYFTADEYAGGWDDVSLDIPAGAANVEVNLFYQTTSREYIEFLRNEVNGGPSTTLTGTGPLGLGDPNGPYLIQTDTTDNFFPGLKGWGNTIWGLWVHNMNKMGAKPFLMAQAFSGTPPTPCSAPAPALLSTEAASGQVTLNWSDEHTVNPEVVGYTVYYDQADKSQFITDIVGLETSFTDTGLVNGQQYCYKVTSKYTDCESEFSNILCATPEAPGQGAVPVGVNSILTGFYSGKGKTRTFNSTVNFNQGDEVTFQVTVLDENDAPIEGATVDLTITGPSSVVVSTGTSDAAGIAEGSWKTTTRKGGTPLGTYIATTTGVTATGYEWDSVETSTTFEITE
ncbi:fibronectin type III domain-containing protein, partial [Thermodesulfobacteriota bacterium]